MNVVKAVRFAAIVLTFSVTALISARAEDPYQWTPVYDGTPGIISISSVSSLSSVAINNGATYAVVQAIGGPAYYTFNSSTPSSSNYQGTLAAQGPVAVQGIANLRAFQIIGAQMVVSYFR